MNERQAAPGHAWQGPGQGWTIGFWLFMAVATARLATAGDLATGPRAGALACIAAITLAFLVFRPDRQRSAGDLTDTVYLLITIAATGLACTADSSLSLLLCIVFPQVGLYSPGPRSAAWLTALTGAVATLGLMTGGGWDRENAGYVLPIMFLSTAFSIGYGRWVTRIIDQSAERSHLIGQLEATRAELGRVHHAQGVTAERERLAREIHDTLAQGFTSIVMLAQLARANLEQVDGKDVSQVDERLALIEEVARENLGEARALVAAFGPVGLDGSTLAEAVRRLTGRFGAETRIAAEVTVDGDLTGLTRDREVVLLRAAQEALANVRRHSAARSVRVGLIGGTFDARIEIVDDGKGFDTFAADRPLGFGLTGMRDRAQALGGGLEVASTPGHGTRIMVRVPKNEEEAG